MDVRTEMNTAYLFAGDEYASERWSLCAGLYMFGCATAVALLFFSMFALAAEVIGFRTGYWAVIIASPAFVIGAVVWLGLVERRRSYSYVLGGAFGFITALATGLLWTTQFIRVWSLKMMAVPMVAVLIALVLGISGVAGVLTALPLMYVRRRVNTEPAGRAGPR